MINQQKKRQPEVFLIRILKRYIGVSFRLIRLNLCKAFPGLFRNSKDEYFCPICEYKGIFLNMHLKTGVRKRALCPVCGALERHRLQYLVYRAVTEGMDLKKLHVVHFAPEFCFDRIFRREFGTYQPADLSAYRSAHKEDITDMSFDDGSVDFLHVSHVLEHVKDDRKAIAEISRVLSSKGIAIIAVPIIGNETVEYPEANPHEDFHVRCPGPDYYDRLNNYFSEVKIFSSDQFDEKYQTYVYADRSSWPDTMPLRSVKKGEKHLDMVAVCYKQSLKTEI